MGDSKGGSQDSGSSGLDNFVSSLVAGVVSGVIVLVMGPSVQAWWRVHGAKLDREMQASVGPALKEVVFIFAVIGVVTFAALVGWLGWLLWRRIAERRAGS
jgi:hypothetical protein